MAYDPEKTKTVRVVATDDGFVIPVMPEAHLLLRLMEEDQGTEVSHYLYGEFGLAVDGVDYVLRSLGEYNPEHLCEEVRKLFTAEELDARYHAVRYPLEQFLKAFPLCRERIRVVLDDRDLERERLPQGRAKRLGAEVLCGNCGAKDVLDYA